MKAMVLTSPNVVEVQQVDEPGGEAEEVVLNVLATGLRESDLHSIDGSGSRQPPLITSSRYTTPRCLAKTQTESSARDDRR